MEPERQDHRAGPTRPRSPSARRRPERLAPVLAGPRACLLRGAQEPSPAGSGSARRCSSWCRSTSRSTPRTSRTNCPLPPGMPPWTQLRITNLGRVNRDASLGWPGRRHGVGWLKPVLVQVRRGLPGNGASGGCWLPCTRRRNGMVQSAGDGPPALGDASMSTVGAGKAAGFFARRDITRRTTGRTNCTMAATDAGMPTTIAMLFSQAQVMGDGLPTPEDAGIERRGVTSWRTIDSGRLEPTGSRRGHRARRRYRIVLLGATSLRRKAIRGCFQGIVLAGRRAGSCRPGPTPENSSATRSGGSGQLSGMRGHMEGGATRRKED